MKKYLYCVFVFLFIFLISGCGSNKSLKCTRDNDYNNQLTMNQKLNISFKNDKLNKLSMEMNVSLSDEYLSFRDSLIESAESEFKEINSKAVSYSTKQSDNGFTFNVKVDYNKLSNEEKQDLYIVDYEKDYNGIKTELIDAGYNCK